MLDVRTKPLWKGREVQREEWEEEEGKVRISGVVKKSREEGVKRIIESS